MKPASSSVVDVQWEFPWNLNSNPIPLGAFPTQKVMKIIAEIEKGKLPVVSVRDDSALLFVHKESFPVYEAYVRCHISLIPINIIESEVNDDQNPMPEEEPDREPVEREV